MKDLIVIADDLTGAAELAGIGLRFGLAAQLIIDRAEPVRDEKPLSVINAETRSLPAIEAARVISDLVGRLDPSVPLFKKVDSTFRGHLAAETDAILDASKQFDRVLLLPQNPTRNRVVRPDGTYWVDNVALAKTPFAFDPDHPARSSNIMDRLVRSKRPAKLRSIGAGPLEAGVVTVAVAETFKTVREWIALATPSTLIVGAADLFAAMLQARGHQPKDPDLPKDFGGRRLYLCGSTASSSRRLLRSFATSNDLEIVSTAQEARRTLREKGIAIVMSPEPGGVERDPREIEEDLGQIGKQLIGAGECDWCFAEGGATAAAVCRATGWKSLEVESELASGVVCLKPALPMHLVIKPGSYPWPEEALRMARK